MNGMLQPNSPLYSHCTTLLFDAVAQRCASLHVSIALSRHRIRLIERSFGLSPQHLEQALAADELALTDQQALTWYRELKQLRRLEQDLSLLQLLLARDRKQPNQDEALTRSYLPC